jgi:hypothetical protein
MEIIDFKLGIHTSMRLMQRTNQGISKLQTRCLMQTWTIVVIFDP